MMNSKSTLRKALIILSYGHLIFTLIIFQLGFFRYQISSWSWITTEAVIVDEKEYTFEYKKYGTVWGTVKQASVKYEIDGQLYRSDVLMSYKDEVGDVIKIAVKKRDYGNAIRYEFLPLSSDVIWTDTGYAIYLLIDTIYSIIKKKKNKNKASSIDEPEEKDFETLKKVDRILGSGCQFVKVPVMEGGNGGCECYENGLLKMQIDLLGNVTTYVYDETGIITATANPADNVITVKYDSDGNIQSITDSEGSTVTLYHNESGEIVSATDMDGNEIIYTYDCKEKCITCTDSAENIIQYYYDVMGQVVSVVKKKETGNTVVSYKHDAFGNIMSLTDGVGKNFRLTYGREGRGGISNQNMDIKELMKYI